MLDLAGILFSSIMMLVVIFRAISLDKSEPWFVSRADKGAPKPDAARPAWRRAPQSRT